MMKRFAWRGHKSGDGDDGATNTPTAPQGLRDACVPKQHTAAPYAECSRHQSGDKATSLSSPSPSSAAESQLEPSLPSSSCRNASTALPPSPQHGTPQDVIPSDTEAFKKDYWLLAVNKLQEEDSSAADQLTGVQQAAAAAGNADFAPQLLHTTQQGRQELESKRWKISTGSREVVLRDQFDRLVKAVTLFKDVGNAAGSIDPLHAGLPLAGFCVLMQMATNDLEQYAAMVAGVEEIVTIVARYSQIEALYLSRPKTVLKQEFERHLLSLYKHIIRYQISATCYYRRNTMLRFIRALPKLDDVSEAMAKIRQDDVACRNIGQVFDSSDALERHQELLDKLDRFEKYLMNQNEMGRKQRPRNLPISDTYNAKFDSYGSPAQSKTPNGQPLKEHDLDRSISPGRLEAAIELAKSIQRHRDGSRQREGLGVRQSFRTKLRGDRLTSIS